MNPWIQIRRLRASSFHTVSQFAALFTRKHPGLSNYQCRAARALIGWSQSRLAAASKVAVKTIADFEREDRTPYERTLSDVRSALKSAGVEFTNGDQPSVRMKPVCPGDKVRLRRTSERHAPTFAIEPGEVATVEQVESLPGQAPGSHLRLRLASGALTPFLSVAHFERMTKFDVQTK